MATNCERKEFPAQPALYMHATTPVEDLPQVLGNAYGKVFQYLSEQGEQPAGMPYCAYFNMDMQNLEVEIGFPVEKALPGQAEILSGELPAGKYATCFHFGPYQDMTASYDRLNQWMQENGCEPTGAVYEFYYNSPEEVAPEELKTEIRFPLKGG